MPDQNKFTEGLKKILLAGVGAAATVAEKTEEVVEEWVKKGELTVEQGRVLNEELKRSVEKRRSESDAIPLERILKAVDLLSAEEREIVRQHLETSEDTQDD
ncbi:MAG TPA: aspartyl beta-hydroxylase [Clostridia bacterium]|nr:aspartyl beta-hydroxylase [Clostridia bacterium]